MTYYKPKIGYVVKRYPRYSETFIVNEILAHESVGIEIDIFSLRTPNDTHFQNIISQVNAPVFYLPSSGIKATEFWQVLNDSSTLLPGLLSAHEKAKDCDAYEVYQAILLAREVDLRGINHLHAHFASLASTVTRLAASFAGIAYTLTAHAKDIYQEDVRYDELKQKFYDAAAVITVSDYNVKYLKEHYDVPQERIKRIYNGLALDQFPYKSPVKREPTIIAVGRLVEKKGFSNLVKACANLSGKGINYNCKIIGTGELEDDLRSQIEQLGLQEKVLMLGPQPQCEVIKLIHEASVLAAPCIIANDGNRDGLPTVLLEAMALGTPCVSTNVTGIPEIIEDEVTGLIVEQDDLIGLTEEIERLLVDAGLREKISISARQLIEKEFEIFRNTENLRAIFRDAIQTPPKLFVERY